MSYYPVIAMFEHSGRCSAEAKQDYLSFAAKVAFAKLMFAEQWPQTTIIG